MWQQFEFGFPTGSNPAPPNLLKSTLANPVWNTGDKLVFNKVKETRAIGDCNLGWFKFPDIKEYLVQVQRPMTARSRPRVRKLQ